MRYGVVLPTDENVRELVELGYEAEQSGWDGVFVWDCIDSSDPWITLGAIAMRTARVRLGSLVTPVSRRRPWKLAQETTTLDHLSVGRAILPVGLGAPNTGFDKVGEETDRKIRAELLDEGLEIVSGLWGGGPFSFEGAHYKVREMTFSPRPLQEPRIPIWVVAAWPRMKSMQRALRWDGVVPMKMGEDGTLTAMTPDDIRAMKAFIDEQRTEVGAFDIVFEGDKSPDDPREMAELSRPYAEAGATWWLENVWDGPQARRSVERMRERIRLGSVP